MTKFRLWLIRKIAGKDLRVMLNMYVKSKNGIEINGNSLVYGNTFDCR